MTSRKDYELAAKLVRQRHPRSEPARNRLATLLVAVFSQTNKKFDAWRFYEACGVDNEKRDAELQAFLD